MWRFRGNGFDPGRLTGNIDHNLGKDSRCVPRGRRRLDSGRISQQPLTDLTYAGDDDR